MLNSSISQRKPNVWKGRLILPDGTPLLYRTGTSYQEVAHQLEADKQHIAQGLPVEVERGYYHTVAALPGALVLEEHPGTWVGSLALDGKELLFLGGTRLEVAGKMANWVKSHLVPLIGDQVNYHLQAERDRLAAVYIKVAEYLALEAENKRLRADNEQLWQVIENLVADETEVTVKGRAVCGLCLQPAHSIQQKYPSITRLIVRGSGQNRYRSNATYRKAKEWSSGPSSDASPGLSYLLPEDTAVLCVCGKQ